MQLTMRTRMAAVAACTAAAAATAVILLTASPSLGATLQVSPSGSDSGGCVPGPCRTIGYAYGKAAPGDAISLASGSYSSTTLSNVSGRGAGVITIGPAAGASPVVSWLDIRANNVAIQNLTITSLNVNGADAVSIQGVTARTMYFGGARNLLLRGGSIGPSDNGATLTIGGGTNLTIDGVDFHDATVSNAQAHSECIWVSGVDGFTVRNSIFRNCAYFNIFFTRYMGPDPRNVLLENNVFERTFTYGGSPAPYAIDVSDHLTRAENFRFVNNTFQSGLLIQPSGPISNFVVANNIGTTACRSGVAFASNVWANDKCSASDKRASSVMSSFVDPAGHDWRLKAGSPAIGAADPGSAPKLDRDGYQRDGAPDAGAHEFGAGPPKPVSSAGSSSSARAKARILRFARLTSFRICAAPRADCPRVTRLAIRAASTVNVRVRLDRMRGGRSPKRVRALSKRLAKGASFGLRIRAATLSKGTYRLTVVATTVGSKRSTLQRFTFSVR